MTDRTAKGLATPGGCATFDRDCRRCVRLAHFLDRTKAEHPTYYARPVPPFGDPDPALLIVGLAPGMHGANRSGRPFTGDFAGILLYETLYAQGLSSGPTSQSVDDGLQLFGARITNAVKCLPPENKPLPAEVRECSSFLRAELAALRGVKVILALGRVAHESVLDCVGLRRSAHIFAHGAEHELPGGLKLVDSYHCSRYNTQTRRLTTQMFRSVVAQAAALAGVGASTS